MKHIFIATKTGSDWQGLLADPKLHWKKGASAMTAAAAWEDAGGALPSEIETALQSTNEEALRFFVHLTRSRRVSDGSKLCATSLWEARVCAGMYNA